jgi:hypothetical protein
VYERTLAAELGLDLVRHRSPCAEVDVDDYRTRALASEAARDTTPDSLAAAGYKSDLAF